MLRELKFFRRNSGKNPTTDANNENLPLDQTVSSASQQDADPSRLPFSAIQEPERNPRSGLDQETYLRRKSERTPSKIHAKGSDQFFQSRTPDKLPASKGRFGWASNIEQAGLTSPERREYSLHQGQFQMPPPPPFMANHALNFGNGYSAATPRSIATGGRASSVHSGTSSTQSTPTKSVSKPMINGVSNSRAPQCGGTAKAMNFLVSSKGIPLSSAPPPVYASVEVPHFELKEDPSFWMDHNVQVVIRVRPINIIERGLQGYSRCIKQESAQSITWIGQSETRFMFDYIACETVNQEMLFRVVGLPMVENCMSGYNSCVFAYGQTGSGKTHTMLGEINDLEIRPSTNRGMTPRIFEFLFARIKAEEESRRDEKLKYTCKCSFLEIYNEQITDLLNPTSTNLLIREDPRKGVHVENLSEFEVENVYDTLQLLIQGAANRKVAATMMNRESSRSHSVFTCTIESRWQKDSTSTLRFARLNLVDLAGSERQKTSGAEGDRLKEASNINKSLSTLGHVIMVLADLANGRQRHVPYRDSRLTFLLQDSLGGNSKTMIIANVSPSMCSANETLSTLKFAQRAKVIQNNAVVNENASGDVFALQHQIHLLKEELSMLKQQNISRSLSFRTATLENADYDAYSPQKLPGTLSDFNQIPDKEELQDVRVLNKQLKSFEAMLAGAFRREKMAAIAMRQLETEIEQLNRLVRQREEDTQCSKMMIKFREDKIYRMEALLNGLIPSESYLREENNALSEEIKLLRTKVDRNPEVTRFASENIRLLEELRKFQDFYDEGERGLLLTELSELRNQLAQFLDGNLKSDINAQDICLASPEKVPCSCSTKQAEEVSNLEQELDRLKAIIAVEKSSRVEAEERAIFLETELSITNDKLLQISKRYDVTIDKLKYTRPVIDALESQQMLSINELEELRENNNRLADTVKIQEQQISTMKNQLALRIDVGNRKSIIAHDIMREDYSESECSSPFQDKLKRVQASLEKAWNLNMRYQSDQASHSSSEREMDEVRRQVEAETAEVIVCLQEELTTVNQIVDECKKNELLAKKRLMDLEKEKKEQDDKLYLLTLENIRLAKLTEEKDQNVSSIMEHWEQLAIEISDLLENGKTQLDDATHEAAAISDICSHKSWICEQFGKIIMGISKRDSLIEELQKNLEDACYVRHDMESKLMTLRGATLAITEAQQQENSDKESRILHLTSLLAEKTSIISELEDKVEDAVRKVRKAEICAAIFFLAMKNLYEINEVQLQAMDETNLQLRESESSIPQKDDIRQGHASLFSIEGEGCQNLRAQVEQNYQQTNCLEHWKHSYLDTSSNYEEGNITTPDSSCGLVEANLKLQDIQMQMSTLKSCMHEYADNQELELEISEVKAVAAHKTIETSNILLQIEAAQEAKQEANVVVNALMEANKIANLEIDRLKKTVISQCLERCYLAGELQDLQTSLDEKDKNLERIQNSLKSNITEAMDLVLAVEDQFMGLKNAFVENFTLIKHDLDGLKSWIPHHIESRMWLEEIWLGIIGKDCTVSVSHLCHVGFLLERITGLNRENRFLQNGLSESNSLVTNLRKQNTEAKRELNMCNVLKGRLLFDISHCFSRITDKEHEISEFSAKLNSFEEKIVGLQFIEETMLERSNSICHELDVLSDKLNAANKDNALRAAVQEKLMKDNDEANERLEELSLLLNKVQVTNKTLRDELDMEFNEKVKVDEKLGMELFNLNNLLDRKKHLLEDLQKEMYCIKYEKDKLESNVSTLTEKLILVEVNKSIAAEQVENQLMENEGLKLRLIDMSMVLDQKKYLYEDLQKEICCFKHENDKLESHVSTLTEKLILVEENKAIAAAELENQLMENEELKLRLMGMSIIIEELQRKYEVACKESDNMKTIAMERLKKELLDASILIGQGDVLVEELQKDVSRIAHEKDEFESEAYSLKEKLILVEENKVIVAEQLENQLSENEELKLRLMAMSMELDELQGKYEVVCEESNNMKTIALERLKKELLDASILIGQRDVLVEELQKNMSRIAHEKDEFESEAYTLKEKLKLAKSIAEKYEAVETEAPQRKLLMENEQLKLQVENMTRMLYEVQTLNQNLQEELEDKMSSEILQKKLHDLLSERSNVLEEFQNEITVILQSKEQLESQVSILKEKLKMAESLAVEARQIAEERRSYAQVKEEEVKLLERSIEELECTVNALQEQVKIVKGEAERQRIQRNELEMEEEAKRQLKENLSELENAQHSIQLLQKEATERELELVQCKSIISELNLHAEAQASEYNRKFKELEAMAFQLKTELVTSNTANPISTKSEKVAAKSRGSGSPFKCIVGLAQQINTEKDEELTVARCKIEELEALAASRQNQIFMLNIRLAAAESMTHDVLRDLLGIKLDMTKYAKMNGGSHSDDSMKEKDIELVELKRKVDEFVEERKSLLEEINRRQKELIAAQIRLGKLEEHEEFLSTENDLLKADNAKYKSIVMELEDELDKIAIQLNMQQPAPC